MELNELFQDNDSKENFYNNLIDTLMRLTFNGKRKIISSKRVDTNLEIRVSAFENRNEETFNLSLSKI